MVYIIGFFTTLLSLILIMPKTIDFLHKIKFGQTEREEGLDSHKKKNGTPTMGGIVFILIPVIIYLITYFAGFIPMDLNAVILLLAFIGYGLIGFIDDYIIVVKKDNQGLKPKTKFLMQSILAIVFFLLYRTNSSLSL